jgi:hypothetical protein
LVGASRSIAGCGELWGNTPYNIKSNVTLFKPGESSLFAFGFDQQGDKKTDAPQSFWGTKGKQSPGEF